ncbi:MAG: hypothetical protein IAE97_12935 [Chthoniobacterales bacterium]|nr:hypothetical protein [Chthoniobacterales bacterium]
MNTTFVIIVAAAAIAAGFLLSGHRFPRLLGAFVLAGLAMFCAVGFQASYEVADPSDRRSWQLAYGILGAVSGGGALLLLMRVFRK